MTDEVIKAEDLYYGRLVEARCLCGGWREHYVGRCHIPEGAYDVYSMNIIGYGYVAVQDLSAVFLRLPTGQTRGPDPGCTGPSCEWHRFYGTGNGRLPGMRQCDVEDLRRQPALSCRPATPALQERCDRLRMTLPTQEENVALYHAILALRTAGSPHARAATEWYARMNAYKETP